MKIITVGRSLENLIVLEDKRVSSKHLLLKQDENGNCFVQDLNSTNGTFVNEIPINADFYLLKQGDIIKIGETILNWQDLLNEKSETILVNLPEEAIEDSPNLVNEISEPIKEVFIPISSPKPDKNIFILKVGVAIIGLIFLALVLIWYFTQVVRP